MSDFCDNGHLRQRANNVKIQKISHTNPHVPLTIHLRVRTAVPPPHGREHWLQSDHSVQTGAAAAAADWDDGFIDVTVGVVAVVVVVLETVFGVDLKITLSPPLDNCPFRLTEFGTSPIAES
jgi:hypothetical protein